MVAGCATIGETKVNRLFQNDVHIVVKCANGYRASIIHNRMSNGYSAGKYELAVMDSDGEFVYDTPITHDVLGYLTGADVVETVQKVAALTGADVVYKIPKNDAL